MSTDMRGPTSTDASLSRAKFLVLAAAIAFLALVLREQFVQMTQVEAPIRGDIRQYVAYAFNLIHSGTFSATEPGTGTGMVEADSFRGPGYPLFLMVTMMVSDKPGAWYELALHGQALLGAATVLMVIGLGRLWLSRSASLGAGLLLAIWPHHIAATGALLSEVLFGFVLVAGVWLAAIASRDRRLGWGLGSGLTFGFAYLVNPAIALFPAMLGFAIWKRNRTAALFLILIPAIVAIGWDIRNSKLPVRSEPGRAAINLVQGSWPNFHLAHAFRYRDPVARQILTQIDDESRLLSSDPTEGLSRISERIQQDPRYYLRWYFVEKPYLLWDWDVRVGYGDVYFLEVNSSPLETNPVLLAMKDLLHRLNFPIFLLSAAASLIMLFRYPRSKETHCAPAIVAGLCIYLTLVHLVFQAEPRYSTAYRPFQMLMAVSALSFIAAWIRAKFPGRPDGPKSE